MKHARNRLGIVGLFMAGGVLLVTGCASNESYLLDRVSPENKAAMLVREGADEYKTVLVDKKDFREEARIRKYFQVALEFDPSNTEAKKFLDQIDALLKTEFTRNLAEAKRLDAKNSRKIEEDYALTLAVRKISAIKPDDPEVRKLVRSTEKARKNYLATRQKEIDNLLAKAKTAKTEADREKTLGSAFRLALEVVNAVPGDGRAASQEASLRKELTGIFQAKLSGMAPLVKQFSFTKASALLDQAKKLNDSLSGQFLGAINQSGHDLYYAWGKYNADRGDNEAAAARLDTALKYQRSTKALALRKQVAYQPVVEVPFATVLDAIKDLLEGNRLADAVRAIDRARDRARTEGKTAELTRYEAAIPTQAKELYARGLAAYREERFDEAIQALEPVNAWNPAYEQVADYLQKAVDKQKILNEY